MKIQFIIRGNQKEENGNPIPYKRTLSHVHSKISREYHEWLDYVRAEFERSAMILDDIHQDKECLPTKDSFPYPDFSKFKADISVTCAIGWKDGHHGDVDNVLKGILDALFKNDKCVFAISAIALPAEDKKGLVEVTLDFLKL